MNKELTTCNFALFFDDIVKMWLLKIEAVRTRIINENTNTSVTLLPDIQVTNKKMLDSLLDE